MSWAQCFKPGAFATFRREDMSGAMRFRLTIERLTYYNLFRAALSIARSQPPATGQVPADDPLAPFRRGARFAGGVPRRDRRRSRAAGSGRESRSGSGARRQRRARGSRAGRICRRILTGRSAGEARPRGSAQHENESRGWGSGCRRAIRGGALADVLRGIGCGWRQRSSCWCLSWPRRRGRLPGHKPGARVTGRWPEPRCRVARSTRPWPELRCRVARSPALR